MNPNINHVFEARFKTNVETEASLELNLQRLQSFLRSESLIDPLLKDTNWLISTGTRDSSYLYPVFDLNGPSPAALAVIRQDLKRNDAVKGFSLWNGQEDPKKAASIFSYFDRQDKAASSLRLSVRSPRTSIRLGTWDRLAGLLATAAHLYEPLYSSVETKNYQGVFGDRPGVGWMLYLPRILTVQQVPEARVLVPVMAEDKRKKPLQIGTVIVSVTDEPFSDDNPEHVRIANAIEIRLVDQDLLPRYAEL